MKFLRSLLVVALLQATAATSALAADDLSQIKSAGVFRVGTEGTYANTLTSNFGKLAAAHGADVVPVQGFNESIDLLTSGRVDATINDSLSYLDFRKHKPDAKLKIAATDQTGAGDASGVLLRKGSPALVAAIDKALADIKA
ncbi:transporter substrate-binding domain-containing protein, partial [Burkholderia cenocepacia]|nr:transporter substrate-binding domain-containing protein [Burkholderia cenocepacia]